MSWGLCAKGTFFMMYRKRKILLQATPRICAMRPFEKNVITSALCEPHEKQQPDEWLLQNQLEMEAHLFLYSCLKTPVAVICAVSNVCVILYRLSKLVIIFTPVLLLYPASLISPGMHNLWWKYFLFSIQISGPVFVKLSQWASTRRDMFSSRTCSYLSSLQRHRSPHSWFSTCRAMEKAFGSEWREMFHEFDEEPIGSGCVAQVYRAYLKYEAAGKRVKPGGIPFWKFWAKEENERISDSFQPFPVAVKVLHPFIKKQFEQNIEILQFCARVLEFIVPSLKWLSLTDSVKEFQKFMFSQIDLTHEARMSEVFHENFKATENVHFPKPIWPYVSSEVLIETWEEGIPMSHFLSDKHPHFLKKKLADIGIDVLLKMVFSDNFVHSDLHPGNILVQNSGFHLSHDKKTNKLPNSSDSLILSAYNPTIPLAFVILDCGLVSSLPIADFSKFVAVFRAVALGQYDAVGELFLKHSVNECSNPEKFKREMCEIISSARTNTLTLDKVDVGKLLGSVFSLLTTHRIKLESNFASLLLAIMVLEGLGRSLDPSMDLIEKAKPYLCNNIYLF